MTANWLANLNNNKARLWMNSQGTWVMDRTDATCPDSCRMHVVGHDADSLRSKYKMVKDAGWAGVGMWQANAMFPADEAHPDWLNVYDSKAVRMMWDAIAEAWK